jgi:hypothetical protein
MTSTITPSPNTPCVILASLPRSQLQFESFLSAQIASLTQVASANKINQETIEEKFPEYFETFEKAVAQLDGLKSFKMVPDTPQNASTGGTLVRFEKFQIRDLGRNPANQDGGDGSGGDTPSKFTFDAILGAYKKSFWQVRRQDYSRSASPLSADADGPDICAFAIALPKNTITEALYFLHVVPLGKRIHTLFKHVQIVAQSSHA